MPSRSTIYRRKKRAAALGVSVGELPDGRGKHGNHVRGEEHPRWNESGKMISSEGYVKIRVGKGHHLADVHGFAYEHRVVMEQALGRKLEDDEVVHHLNEDKQDNRTENLVIRNRGRHTIYDHGLDEGRDANGRFAPQ